MNKLAGINLMLQTCGQMPFPALQTGGTGRPAQAELCLDAESALLQSRGWAFNRRRNVTLTAQAVGGGYRFVPPNDILALDPDRVNDDWVLVEGGLFDRTNNTFDTSSGATIVVSYTLLVPFEDLPPTFAHYAATSAAMPYLMQFVRDTTMIPHVMREIARAKARALEEDIDQGDVNVLGQSHVADIKGDRLSSRGGDAWRSWA